MRPAPIAPGASYFCQIEGVSLPGFAGEAPPQPPPPGGRRGIERSAETMIDGIAAFAGRADRGARRLALALLAAGPLLLAALVPPAAAQDIRSQVQRLQQELQTLQRHVYGGGATAGSGSAATGAAGGADLSRPQAARLELRLNELETQMRGLTGEVERIGFRIEQVSGRLEQIAADLNARLQRLEQQPVAQLGAADPAAQGYGAQPAGQLQTQPQTQPQTATMTPPSAQPGGQTGAQAGAPAAGGTQLAPGETGPQVLGSVNATNLETLRQQAQQGATTQGQAPVTLGTAAAQASASQATASQTATGQAAGTQTAAVVGGQSFATPKAQYDNAFTLLSQANYPAAEQALSDFISANPQDPLAGNAMYWLGETHYVRGQYREAAVTFAEGYQTYPNSPKAPDNLLKLGKSLAALDQNEDACGTFAELLRRYPKAPTNVVQQAQREQQRLSCAR